MHLVTTTASPQTSALLALLTLGRSDIRAGRYQSADIVFAELDREEDLFGARRSPNEGWDLLRREESFGFPR